MNKKIKRVIALALTISAFSTFSALVPGDVSNFFVKPAYAASYRPSAGELSKLTVKSTNGDTLDLKDGYNGEVVKLSDSKDYYVKLTDDSEGIKINAEVKGSDRIVRIFLSNDPDAKAYKPGDKLPLSKGNTEIYVRTYESLNDFRKAKDQDKDVRKCEEDYTVKVKKTTAGKYEDDSQDPIYLSNLEVNKGSLTFSKQRTTYDLKVNSSVNEIKITAKPENSSSRVRIDGSLVDSNNNYRNTVSLDKGKNTIKVKVTDSKDNQRVYTLNIVRGKESDAEQDDIYLSNLEVSEGKLDFSEDKTSYSFDVDNDVDKFTVTAEPSDNEYLVTINGDEVNSGDDYKKKVSLKEGENKIPVVIEDEVNNKKRTYTITVNRKEQEKAAVEVNTDTNNSNSNSNSTSDSNSNENATVDKNATENSYVTEKDPNKGTSCDGTGWTKSENGWQYKDKSGNILKNQWIYDEAAKVYCYLKEDGFRKTGWFKDNDEKWYLLADNGAMLKGWQKDGDKYYYLDSHGIMQMGWLKLEEEVTDSNSKDKNKKTVWYYLDGNGEMFTGWLHYGNDWYYFNSNGSMATGWIVDNGSKYYLNEDGSMQTKDKTIDGKEYKFTTSGALVIK